MDKHMNLRNLLVVLVGVSGMLMFGIHSCYPHFLLRRLARSDR